MCDHDNFECLCHVVRLSEQEGWPVVGYVVEIRVICTDCHTPFHFQGMPGGLRNRTPTISFDGTEARLPIAPGVLAKVEGESSVN